MRFYTNFFKRGDFVYITGYDNGRKTKQKIKFKPTLYVPSKSPSDIKTIYEENVSSIDFDSISEAREFIKTYKDVDNFKIYGSDLFEYVCVNQLYGKDYDRSLIRIMDIDIEVASDDGFPDPEEARKEIISIAFSVNTNDERKHYILGTPSPKFLEHQATKCKVLDIEFSYKRIDQERKLVMEFLTFYTRYNPDVITGWYVATFDLVYLYNRITKLYGHETANKLSPFNLCKLREYEVFGQRKVEYDIYGVSVIDYLDLYKKFTYSQEESYKLDYIAEKNLGIKKVDHSEYETLHQFYLNDYPKFLEYNGRDVLLVDMLEEKMDLLGLVFSIAYDAQVNYLDTFTQVRMWDVIIHNFLIERGKVIPQKSSTSKGSQFEGAFVKDPKVGMTEWLMSFDLDSLYPHLIMQYNISPETLIDGDIEDVDIANIIETRYRNGDITNVVAGNGVKFRKDKHGFLPQIMETMYAERKEYKNKMLEYKKELEEVNRRLEELC